MPPDTELIPAPVDPSQVNLSSIQDALKQHIPLDLKRFGENCVETSPLPGKDPMKLRLLHTSPPVLEIQNFLTQEECKAVQDVTVPRKDGESSKDALQVGSATFSALATSKRTSTSWFCHYAQMPTLLAKANNMLGITIEQMEEPQIVRYRAGEEFSWHYDEIPATELENGGQRIATLLLYLNDVENGGGTIFKHLKSSDGKQLTMKPRVGSALLFFPAFADGRADDRTLHKGEVVVDTTKWITQMWIHQRAYRPVTPPGNSHEAALPEVKRVSDSLQYTSSDQ
jgi:prolyl 4-hydroxylase